jgi:hypothetical protein
MSSKTFRVATQTEKIEFELEWLDASHQRQSRTFHCRPTVPLQLILDFADMSTKSDEEENSSATGIAAMNMVSHLFEVAIVPDEYPAFKQLLDDPDIGITVETYSEIAGWLAGEYTARPTGKNSEGSSPAVSSGNALTDGASVTELTYFRPEPTEAIR